MWYTVDDNRVYEWSDNKFRDNALFTELCDEEEYNAKPYKFIIVDGVIAINPSWEEIEEEKERERIGNLRCTKRVFVLMLERACKRDS